MKTRYNLTSISTVIFFFASRRRHTRCSRDWSSDVCFSVTSRRRHTRCSRDWSSDVCSSDLEVRRRNLIPREAYPFTSASGMTYDSGDFPKALEQVLAAVDYDGLRREQAAARAGRRLVGVGLACYPEYTGMGAQVFRRRGMSHGPGI